MNYQCNYYSHCAENGSGGLKNSRHDSGLVYDISKHEFRAQTGRIHGATSPVSRLAVGSSELAISTV